MNAKNARFLMGGIKLRKSPHAEFTHFEWTLPRALATEAIRAVARSAPFVNKQLFAMQLSDLGAPNTFEPVPNSDLKRDHQEIDAIEVHNLLTCSDQGKQCGLLGVGIKIFPHMFYVLHTSNVETTRDLPPLNSLGHSLFFDTHFVGFQGATSTPVQFWEGKGMLTPQLSATSPNAP